MQERAQQAARPVLGLQSEAELEVIALADEVEDAALLVDGQWHAQACGKLLNERAVGADHLG
jgi:hypothetical protein